MHESNVDLPAPRALDVQGEGGRVPTVLWSPEGASRGLVLACHGGSGHKLSGAILAIVGAPVPQGFSVLAIDGAVHGERRSDGDLDPATARQSFRTAWRKVSATHQHGSRYPAALDAAQKLPELAEVPVGYVGVAMGTTYGIPLLGHERRIRAAVIGLWSANYAANAHLLAHAREMRCDVWFTQQWHDEFFDHPGTFALFDAIGSADKRLVAYPGPHVELQGERLANAIAFIAGRLSRAG